MSEDQNPDPGGSNPNPPFSQTPLELSDLKDQNEQQLLLINQLKEMLRKEQSSVSQDKVSQSAVKEVLNLFVIKVYQLLSVESIWGKDGLVYLPIKSHYSFVEYCGNLSDDTRRRISGSVFLEAYIRQTLKAYLLGCQVPFLTLVRVYSFKLFFYTSLYLLCYFTQ